MVQIKLSKDSNGYPVGEHIREYFNLSREIGTIINENFPEKSITLWCRGSSGAIIAALVSQHIFAGVEICHIKKSGENAHISIPTPQHDINIIIDDLMASGDTVEAIYVAMKKDKITPIGIIMTGDLKIYKLKQILGKKYEKLKLLVGGIIFN